MLVGPEHSSRLDGFFERRQLAEKILGLCPIFARRRIFEIFLGVLDTALQLVSLYIGDVYRRFCKQRAAIWRDIDEAAEYDIAVGLAISQSSR